MPLETFRGVPVIHKANRPLTSDKGWVKKIKSGSEMERN